jgi:hypothetical protein
MLLCGLAILSLSGVAAANNETDDGFVWIDANTRIKIKPISTVKPSPAATGATAPEKKTETEKKTEKKEKPKK